MAARSGTAVHPGRRQREAKRFMPRLERVPDAGLGLGPSGEGSGNPSGRGCALLLSTGAGARLSGRPPHAWALGAEESSGFRVSNRPTTPQAVLPMATAHRRHVQPGAGGVAGSWNITCPWSARSAQAHMRSVGGLARAVGAKARRGTRPVPKAETTRR